MVEGRAVVRLGVATSSEEPAQLRDREVERITFLVIKCSYTLRDDFLKRLFMTLLLGGFDEPDESFRNTLVVRHHLHPPD